MKDRYRNSYNSQAGSVRGSWASFKGFSMLLLRRVATSTLHQTFCPYILIVIAAFVTFEGVGLFRGTTHSASALLTMNPLYPIQVGIGLAAGYFIGRYTQWSFARWTWVLPASILLITLAFVPVPARLSRAEYFFGTSGLPKRGMVPMQTAVTMPFYLSLAYSLAAWKGVLDRSRVSAASSAS